MSTGLVTDYVARQWLAIFVKDVWLGLFVTDPSRSGADTAEVIGGAYARKKAAFVHYDPRTVWLDKKHTWTGLPPVILSHIGVMDAQRNGRLLSCALLPSPLPNIRQGASFVLDPYTYAISIGQAI